MCGLCENMLRGELKIKQPLEKDGLRVNVDTILLAHFTRPRKGERILELGCAHGAISLILAKRGFETEGIDIQEHLITLAKENARINGLETLTHFFTGDLREYKKISKAQSYDRVVVNPPYTEAGKCNASPHIPLAAALHGTECTLADVVSAARYLLKNKGRLDMVIRAERSGELISMLTGANIAPKRLQPVYPDPASPASAVLIEAVRAAGQGLKAEPPIFIRDNDGCETPELKAAYTIREKDEGAKCRLL